MHSAEVQETKRIGRSCITKNDSGAAPPTFLDFRLYIALLLRVEHLLHSLHLLSVLFLVEHPHFMQELKLCRSRTYYETALNGKIVLARNTWLFGGVRELCRNGV